MRTNIYVECNTRYVREKERVIGYVVDYTDENGYQQIDQNGEPVVKWGWGIRTATYTGAVLTALAYALSRADITDEVQIMSQNKFLVGHIETRLEEWMETGFVRGGEEIRHLKTWKYIGSKLKGRSFEAWAGHHIYYSWMMDEMKRFRERREKCL